MFPVSDINLCDVVRDMSEVYLGHSVLEISCALADLAHLKCCTARFVIGFCHFRTTYSRVSQPKEIAGPFKVVPICCSEMQVTNCQPLPCSGSLKSDTAVLLF
jgi:hypothetical protein